ncbi:MAG: hypothetical protein Q7T03_06070 [Deltaproteobacteria bacterium]|nr:hypothetical protein [Deltaproteobacteria bacterium]
MKKIILGVLMVISVSILACEREKTVVIKEVAAPVVAPQEEPAVKIKINDGSGSGVDVNIPTN